MKTLCFDRFGAPEVLEYRELPDPVPLDHDERRRRADELFGWVRDGSLQVHIDSRFRLADGALAHTRLESRASSGKVLLIP